jgi:hypothetical protein
MVPPSHTWSVQVTKVRCSLFACTDVFMLSSCQLHSQHRQPSLPQHCKDFVVSLGKTSAGKIRGRSRHCKGERFVQTAVTSRVFTWNTICSAGPIQGGDASARSAPDHRHNCDLDHHHHHNYRRRVVIVISGIGVDITSSAASSLSSSSSSSSPLVSHWCDVAVINAQLGFSNIYIYIYRRCMDPFRSRSCRYSVPCADPERKSIFESV